MIENYITNKDSDIYAIYNLPEEVISVLFAFYSRSKGSLKENLQKMIDDGNLIDEPNWENVLIYLSSLDYDNRPTGRHAIDNILETENQLSEWLESRKFNTTEQAGKFHEKWTTGYGHSCYDKETEVLTDKGWKLFEDIKNINDYKFLSLNPLNNNIEYISAINYYEYDYDGLMYKLKSKYIDLLITPNHKMWACSTSTKIGRKKNDFSLIEAKDLYHKSFACQNGGAEWHGKNISNIEIPINYNLNGSWMKNKTYIQIESKYMLKLIGFFIGDGYQEQKQRGSISFHLKRDRKIEYLKNIISQIPEIEIKNYSNKYYLKCKEIGDFFSHCYDNNRKKIIPDWILDISKENLEYLFDGLINSDGSIGQGCISYSTNSNKLKDQIYELCLKLGYSCYATINNRNIWSIHINKNITKPNNNKLKYNLQDSYEKYSGKIYCVELQKNNILYVRRNGRPVFCGNSVAEHSVIHLAVENVSMLAAKAIEDCRLASYTEKSTRYVVYDNIGFTIPEELSGMSKDIYQTHCQDLIEFYLRAHSVVSEKLVDENPELKSAQVRSQACDICRNILPVSMHTNLGMTINARVLARTISKMLSSKNNEFISIAEQIKTESLKVCPTLLKYADRNEYLQTIEESIKKYIPKDSFSERSDDFLKTGITEDEMIRKLVSSILLDHSQMPYDVAEKIARSFSVETCHNILLNYSRARSEHDPLSRIFEQISFSHEIVVDFGAYRDIQRHRMNTQISQLLTPQLGYVVPDEFKGTELESTFENKMKRSERIYYQILVKTNDSRIAQYCLPMAYRKRTIFTWDLREMTHFVNLRKRSTGHKNYIAVAKEIEQNFKTKYPFVSELLFS